MGLPDYFRFSQNNLQDFVDCPRRFELKYILKQSWPAIVSEPILKFELHQQLGRQFHTLVQRHLAGIPMGVLEETLTDPYLERWWKNYLNFISLFKENKKLAEMPSSIPFDQFHLMAKYDCLIFGTDKKITIIDWKTTQFRTQSLILKKKLQSMVYPFLFHEAHKKEYSAEHIELIYWFPEFPDEPERLNYSVEQHVKNSQYLHQLINDAANLKPGEFRLTANEKLCKYCVFRSLCNRGIQAGAGLSVDSDSADSLSELADLDFNAVEEIRF
jgi:hypothetical protein